MQLCDWAISVSWKHIVFEGRQYLLSTMRMVAAALVGTKDSQKTPARTVGRARCRRCARGQLSISTYLLGRPVS